eukprot:GHVP01032461.1.p2 GENE.GHVP01032461.1~~GHVP01032461.1.p2  ORF type:complete len:129 (+),score=3.93 GHVP01032461.1:155-541(+)
MSYKINSQISDIASTNKAPKKGGAIQAPSSYISGQRRNSLPRHAPSPPSSGGLYRTPPRQLSSHSTALILSPRPKYMVSFTRSLRRRKKLSYRSEIYSTPIKHSHLPISYPSNSNYRHYLFSSNTPSL